MALLNGNFVNIETQTEIELLKTIKTALYEVEYPGGKYLEKLEIITTIYQLYRAKDLVKDLENKSNYPHKDLAKSLHLDLDSLTKEFEYLRDHPSIERIDMAREKLFQTRDKTVQLSKKVGLSDGEISYILRDYAPKPNEDITRYRKNAYGR